MKTLILSLLFLIVFQSAWGQQPSKPGSAGADTANHSQKPPPAAIDTQKILLQNLSRKVDAVKINTDSLAKKLKSSCINCSNRVLNAGEWILVFSPLALFITAAIIIVGGAGSL